MENKKFTPGPWLIEKMGPNMYKIESENEPICRLHDFNYSGESNAQLIAAAPEMYAALEAVQKLINCANFNNKNARQKTWNKVDKALKKAKGDV